MEVHGEAAEMKLRSKLDSSLSCEESHIYKDCIKELRAHLKSLLPEQCELLLLRFYFGKEPKELSVKY